MRKRSEEDGGGANLERRRGRTTAAAREDHGGGADSGVERRARPRARARGRRPRSGHGGRRWRILAPPSSPTALSSPPAPTPSGGGILGTWRRSGGGADPKHGSWNQGPERSWRPSHRRRHRARSDHCVAESHRRHLRSLHAPRLRRQSLPRLLLRRAPSPCRRGAPSSAPYLAIGCRSLRPRGDSTSSSSSWRVLVPSRWRRRWSSCTPGTAASATRREAVRRNAREAVECDTNSLFSIISSC
ncbi:hypothetical protein DAI22_07g147600 [Oryza sativa Japonica Group]|nr:hypothetical protein DAI22_07g147600 [Oryza sativa Japonica Group]